MKTKINMRDDEWVVRQELAACYRAFVHFGWTDLIFTHLSARVPGENDQYIINPFGLMFHEVTARNLIKVDFHGKVIAGEYPYNDAGHSIHTAILKARPDVNIALHSHTRAGMAVSCMECGLLPLTQQSNELLDVLCYHRYGFAVDNEQECEKLGLDISDKWAMIMHNHGLLTVGRTVGEAFYYMYQLENACKVQVDVMATGIAPIVPDADIVKQLSVYGMPHKEKPASFVDDSWSAVVRLLEEKDPSYRA